MKIKKQKAIQILEALGVSAPENLGEAKLTRKLNTLNELATDETTLEDGALNTSLHKCLQALEDGGAIELSDPEEAVEKKAAPAAAAKNKAKSAATEEAATEEEAAPKKAPKKKAKGAPQVTTTPGGAGVKKAKKKKAAQEAPEKVAEDPKGGLGVREGSRSRPYLAGIILKKHGIDSGVTEEMVAELDAAYGKPNPRESKFTLRNAWHCVRGYKKGKETELDEVPEDGDEE